MHDRYALGVWGCDAYCYGYSLPQVLNGGSQDASAFYNNAKAQADYDARLKHIVTHKHPTYGTWGSLSSYIYAFDIQNESQGSMPASTAYGNNPNWLCTRATNLRSNVNNGVKISTGGGQAFADSMLSQNFACSAIDVVALHSYENNLLAAGFKTQMTNALALGSKNNKTVVLQEFGSTGVNAKASWLQAVGQVANFLNIPWMTWQVTKITSGTTGYSQNEFYTTDTAAWSALSSLAANTQGETVATLSENAACSASAQCFSGCCVSGKCSSSVTPFSGTCAKITAQWTQCASSWHCNDGCCTGTFSGNVWKCTDGQGVLGSICLQY